MAKPRQRKKTGKFQLASGIRPPRTHKPEELVSSARKIAFEIAEAVEKKPQLNESHRNAVHLAHEFMNKLKQGNQTPKDAVELLNAAGEITKAIERIKAAEKQRKLGQREFWQ